MKPACPKCSNEETLLVERRPDGNAFCKKCGWSGPYKLCFEKDNGAPRIFWIKDKSPGQHWSKAWISEDPDPSSIEDGDLKLIEYSAYEKLLASVNRGITP